MRVYTPKSLTFLTCLLTFWAALLPAQTRLSVEDAVGQALAAHPLLEAEQHRVAESEGRKRQAGLRPNPTFTFQAENVRFAGSPEFQYWNDTDTFAFLTQPVELGGKRDRRVEAASVGVRRSELGKELLAKQIAYRVKRAYWAAAGARRIHELLLEAAKNFLLTIEYHEVRVREGAMAEADLLRIRLEGERLNLAATNAYLEAEQERINLVRAMGLATLPGDLTFEELTPPDGAPLSGDAQLALEQRTEMSIARLSVEQARANLSLEQARSRPDLNAIVGYKRSAGFDTMLAGVEFDLPFWNRNQGSIDSAGAAISAARAELSSMSAVVRAEVAAAEKDAQIRRRQITESLGPMLKQSSESSAIAQAAYKEGGWDLLRLLDSERLRIETESLYYRALSEYHQSIALLETAMGIEP